MTIIHAAFYKSNTSIVDRVIKWWTRGPYSHCELVVGFTDQNLAKCWSSSHQDGGVRYKEILLDSTRWDIFQLEVSSDDVSNAITWFEQRRGKKYDLLGILGFVWRPTVNSKNRWFCSEALASSLNIVESWRFDPNSLLAVLKKLGAVKL